MTTLNFCIYLLNYYFHFIKLLELLADELQISDS